MKEKYPRAKRIKRGRIAKKLYKAGSSLEEIGWIWEVHPNTVKWYMMEANHASEKVRRDGKKNR